MAAGTNEMTNEPRTAEDAVIKNRDIPALTRIFYTMQEIVSLERRSEWQHERLFSVTKRLRSMPGGGGLPSGIDAVIAEVDEMNHEYGEKIRQYIYELKVAEQVLNGIRHPMMRAFVRMYYVDKVSKAEIMRELDMSEWAFRKARASIEQAERMELVRWSVKDTADGGKGDE